MVHEYGTCHFDNYTLLYYSQSMEYYDVSIALIAPDMSAECLHYTNAGSVPSISRLWGCSEDGNLEVEARISLELVHEGVLLS